MLVHEARTLLIINGNNYRAAAGAVRAWPTPASSHASHWRSRSHSPSRNQQPVR